MTHWDPLRAELDCWAAEERKAGLWLRDDDATGPGPALDRLVAETEGAAVPFVLAVIPALAKDTFGRWIAGRSHVRVAVHGYAHENYAPAGEKPQELGPHRPIAVAAEELQHGLAKIRELFGDRALPMLVPPWNRIAPEVAGELPRVGFRYLSAFGQKSKYPSVPGLITINCNIDLIDWRASRACRPHGLLAAQLARVLRKRRLSGGRAVGVLTHHLVHDEAAWEFLKTLFALTAAHGAAVWQWPNGALA